MCKDTKNSKDFVWFFVDFSSILQIKSCEEIIISSHNSLFWTNLFLCEPSGVSGNIVPPTLRPLPVIQPQLPAVLWLARRDSLVDGLILTADQQKLLPPFVGVQTEEENRRRRVKDGQDTWKHVYEKHHRQQEASLIGIFILFFCYESYEGSVSCLQVFTHYMCHCTGLNAFYHWLIVYSQ